MKTIIEHGYKAGEVWIIVSEPGDGTRYEYLCYYDGYNDFAFADMKFSFKYPAHLNWWEIKDIEAEVNKPWTDEDRAAINKLIEKNPCNHWTLLECIRTAKEMRSVV